MLFVLVAQVRAHAARLLASTLAIVLAVGFVVATLVLNETSRVTLLTAAAAEYVGTDAVVISNDGSPAPTAMVGDLAAVQAVSAEFETLVQVTMPGGSGPGYLQVESVAPDPALRWQRLSAGVLPDTAGQVAVSERVGARVGDVLEVISYARGGARSTTEVSVVGVVDLGSDPTAGLSGRAFVTPEQARHWGAPEPIELRVTGEDDLLPALRSALAGGPFEVRTGIEQAELEAAELTGDQVQLTGALLVFAAVAVLVAALVIANTFTVLLAQRTRELALLRCVGGTAAQIRRGLLGEALLTGLLGSAVGVLTGVAAAAGIIALAGADSPVPLSGVSVPAYAVFAGLTVGTVVTLLSALVPARAATRVVPLAALRPVDPAPFRSRHGVLRLVSGLVLLLPGIGLLALGVADADVLLAVAGGAISFLGVVLLAQRAVPPVVAGGGRLLSRVGGVPAELAAGNAARHPRRTAATATALLIGVTLTTAMVVGAATTRATATAGLEAAYPTDVLIEAGRLPDALLDRLITVEGVAAGTAVRTAQFIGPDGQSVEVQGLDRASTEQVLRSAGELPRDGQVVLPPYLADAWDVADGGQVILARGSDRLALTAVAGSDEVAAPRVSVAQLTALAPQARVGEIWLRLTDAGDEAQTAAVDQVADVTGRTAPLAQVSGLVTVRSSLNDLLDALLLVVIGLLGIAVVIALLGVGNTLALSVIERRQETGMLRALGLTRRQLRAVLAWEATLVAGVAALLGVLLGGAYGLAGVAAVLGGEVSTVLSVPWLQVGAIVVVATLAGLLASVLPARRAARTPPIAAIVS